MFLLTLLLKICYPINRLNASLFIGGLVMRIIKDADERKNEILDAVEKLFSEKGYDETSISEIIEKVGIARGTVYYHFKSKEDMLDALIDRMSGRFLKAAKEISEDKNIPVLERFFKTVTSLNAGSDADKSLNNHMHKPQNALLHQKTQRIILEKIPPILAEIIGDGIRENIFQTPYPYESVEMTVAHVITVFDSDYMAGLSHEEQLKKIIAFIFNIEKLFGAEPGSFTPVLKLFGGDSG
jgi:AcrR family transcriptional regulator